jgi:hypothetical protein
MRVDRKRRWLILGAVFSAGAAGVTFSALTIFAGAGIASATAKPVNTEQPSISGTPQIGQRLTGDRGDWSNNPTSFSYFWARCATNGKSCAAISGARSTSYLLTSADVGHTIRFVVAARNGDGATPASSLPTAVITAGAKPVNTRPPSVSGTPQAGKTLTGDRGDWSNNPTAFSYAWARCAKNGASCAAISGARSTSYLLTSADVGNTIRFFVGARNAAGATGAFSPPTAVITAAPPAIPPRGSGCPSGSGNPDQVGGISPPARLLVDSLQSDPAVVTSGTQTLTIRFHVTSTCGGPVQGALVYATATPYNQFAIPPETPTGADGWASLTFQRLQGFPVSRHQQLIALFVRARKPGENLLLGISTRRLVSIRVNLRG